MEEFTVFVSYISYILIEVAEGFFVTGPILVVVVTFVIFVAQMRYTQREQNRVRGRLEKAEATAFTEGPARLEEKIRNLTESHDGLEQKAQKIDQLLKESQDAIRSGHLFNLYNKQIEQYQLQTKLRASWSFFAAMIAMVSGLAFVFWGGSVMLIGGETIKLAAGGSIATIGGAVSAFIAKTFLDVHRLSVGQLNRYFQQPVINDHILMAQRLADDIGDDDARKRAYELVIGSVSSLIYSSSQIGEDTGQADKS